MGCSNSLLTTNKKVVSSIFINRQAALVKKDVKYKEILVFLINLFKKENIKEFRIIKIKKFIHVKNQYDVFNFHKKVKYKLIKASEDFVINDIIKSVLISQIEDFFKQKPYLLKYDKIKFDSEFNEYEFSSPNTHFHTFDNPVLYTSENENNEQEINMPQLEINSITKKEVTFPHGSGKILLIFVFNIDYLKAINKLAEIKEYIQTNKLEKKIYLIPIINKLLFNDAEVNELYTSFYEKYKYIFKNKNVEDFPLIYFMVGSGNNISLNFSYLQTNSNVHDKCYSYAVNKFGINHIDGIKIFSRMLIYNVDGVVSYKGTGIEDFNVSNISYYLNLKPYIDNKNFKKLKKHIFESIEYLNNYNFTNFECVKGSLKNHALNNFNSNLECKIEMKKATVYNFSGKIEKYIIPPINCFIKTSNKTSDGIHSSKIKDKLYFNNFVHFDFKLKENPNFYVNFIKHQLSIMEKKFTLSNNNSEFNYSIEVIKRIIPIKNLNYYSIKRFLIKLYVYVNEENYDKIFEIRDFINTYIAKIYPLENFIFFNIFPEANKKYSQIIKNIEFIDQDGVISYEDLVFNNNLFFEKSKVFLIFQEYTNDKYFDALVSLKKKNEIINKLKILIQYFSESKISPIYFLISNACSYEYIKNIVSSAGLNYYENRIYNITNEEILSDMRMINLNDTDVISLIVDKDNVVNFCGNVCELKDGACEMDLFDKEYKNSIKENFKVKIEEIKSLNHAYYYQPYIELNYSKLFIKKDCPNIFENYTYKYKLNNINILSKEINKDKLIEVFKDSAKLNLICFKSEIDILNVTKCSSCDNPILITNKFFFCFISKKFFCEKCESIINNISKENPNIYMYNLIMIYINQDSFITSNLSKIIKRESIVTYLQRNINSKCMIDFKEGYICSICNKEINTDYDKILYQSIIHISNFYYPNMPVLICNKYCFEKIKKFHGKNKESPYDFKESDYKRMKINNIDLKFLILKKIILPLGYEDM